MKMVLEVDKQHTLDIINKLHNEFHSYDGKFQTRHESVSFLLSLGIEEAIKIKNWVEGKQG